MKTKTINIYLSILLLCISNLALAGSQQSGEMHFGIEEIAKFAKDVEKTAAANGARFFILSRVGRPVNELPDGIEYTHTAFGVYSLITTEDGQQVPGYMMYNLYQRSDKPDASHLVQDYPIDFFMGVHELKAGIIIPKPELQMRLLQVISSDTYQALHNSKYSAISNPFDNRYQNCTEYTLDVINAALYQTDNINIIKANEKAYFNPQPINISPLKLLVGSAFMSDITLADHEGKVQTATYTTIKNYLEKYNLIQEQLTAYAE